MWRSIEKSLQKEETTVLKTIPSCRNSAVKHQSHSMSTRSCSTTSSDGSAHSATAICTSTAEEDLIQSPSRVREQNHLVLKRATPLIYSPLAEGYEAYKSPVLTENSKFSRSSITSFLPRIPNPSDFNSRWEFMSMLAGDHKQSAHILDISHRRLQPAALKFGITPQIAEHITDFSIHRDCFGKHDLPSFLDLVKDLFPNLKRLTLKIEPEATDITDSNVIGFPEDGKCFSADGPDGQEVQESSLNDSSYVMEKIDAAIELAKREKEKMQRLYILYRLPNLLFINGIEVTEDEKNLAHPKNVNGQRVQNLDFFASTLLLSKESISSQSLGYYCTEENLIGDESEIDNAGLEVEFNRSSINEAEDCSPLRLSENDVSIHSDQISPSLNGHSSISIRDDPRSNAKWKNPPSSRLRMFPHTGISIALKSNENLNASLTAPPMIEESKPPNPPDLPIKSESTSPKVNLDTFLRKGKTQNMVDPKAPKAASEATDVAIAATGQLMSNLRVSLDSETIDKENIANQKRIRSSGRNLEEKKHSPLLGSMVKVKMKKTKNKSRSRPPPSPSPPSASRMSFRSRLKKRNTGKHKKDISTSSLIDDDDDDDGDDDGEEMKVGNGAHKPLYQGQRQ